MALLGTLETLAEIFIAVVGFGAIIATLRRPLSPLARTRILGLLLAGSFGVIMCLAPLLVLQTRVSDEALWSATCKWLSPIFLGFWVLVIKIFSDSGVRGFLIFNLPFTIVVWTVSNVFTVVMVAGITGWPFEVQGQHYVVGIVGGLLGCIASFADMVVYTDE